MSLLNSTTIHSFSGEDSQLVAGAVGLAAALAAASVYYTFGSRDKDHGFPKLPGIQLYHAWNFFQRRYDFLHSNIARNPGGFSFNVLHYNIIALAGEDSRQVFFSNPYFSFDGGYKILLGAAPRVGNVDIAIEENEDGDATLFNKKLNKTLSKDRIQDVFPMLLQDVSDTADRWGKSGRIDPFIEIYNLVFLMTARFSTCHDLTKNEADLRRIRELFLALHTGATPAALLLPWFPSSGRKSIRRTTTELFTLLHTYVEARRHAEPTRDAIDILIAEGETTQNITGFIMAALVAGIITTGIVSSWMLTDLAAHTEWREKCKKEVQEFLSRHCGFTSSGTLCERFKTIPVSAWEDELPILDACIRESQRISVTGTSLRRNLGGETKICGRVVKEGDFLVYSMGDVHMNPKYYPEPHKYDPSRWLQPDGIPDATYSFLGWGAGRHLCTGMKVAKLEMKSILAMFLMRYEYQLVNEDGEFPDPLPVPNRNDIHHWVCVVVQ